jgi:phospholipid/cholesterol/gamma-HCH transport system substrate-binding protein
VRNFSLIGRIAALAAVAIAVIAVIYIVALGGGSSYQVHAVFQNASQLVTGDQVEVASNTIGSVKKIDLTPDGQASLTLTINDSHYQPLHEGTQAIVRLTGLSGIANRYIELRLGPPGSPAIPNGGTIPAQDTTTAVDLDEIFNTLNGPTRKGLQDVFQGSASQYQGQGQKIQQAWQYLNPAVASTSALFSEIDRDTPRFTNFITQTSGLLKTIAQRSTDLSGLVQNLATTTEALASQRTALGQSIQKLPTFMAMADTTFVNLRHSLDVLTQLTNASKPVLMPRPGYPIGRLRALLAQLRPLAEESVPTVKALANMISQPGPNNDLIDLTKLGVPLAAVTVRNQQKVTGVPNVQTCPAKAHSRNQCGAFKVSTVALNDFTPELATDRPYAVDLTGWFEGYTHPGGVDANGGYSRIAPVVNLQSSENGALNLIPGGVAGFLQQFLGTGAPGGKPLLTSGQGDRCPGSMERYGALWYPESGYPCNPSEGPTGQ